MDVSVRPMTEADFPAAVIWLAAPHVKRWWYVDDNLATVEAKYGPRVRGDEPTYMLVVEHDRVAVGLAQWYRWDDYATDRDNYRIAAGELGLDYTIGVADRCGQGVGTAMVARLLDVLRANATAGTPVSVTPQAANAASCRILEKNGFDRIATFQGEHLDGRVPEGPTAVYRRLL